MTAPTRNPTRLRIVLRRAPAAIVLALLVTMASFAQAGDDDYYEWLVKRGSIEQTGPVITSAGSDTAIFHADDLLLRNRLVGRPLIIGGHGPTVNHFDLMAAWAQRSGTLDQCRYVFKSACYGAQDIAADASRIGKPVVAPVAELIHAELENGVHALHVRVDGRAPLAERIVPIEEAWMAAVPRRDGTVNVRRIAHPERLFRGVQIGTPGPNGQIIDIAGTARGGGRPSIPIGRLAGGVSTGMQLVYGVIPDDVKNEVIIGGNLEDAPWEARVGANAFFVGDVLSAYSSGASLDLIPLMEGSPTRDRIDMHLQRGRFKPPSELEKAHTKTRLAANQEAFDWAQSQADLYGALSAARKASTTLDMGFDIRGFKHGKNFYSLSTGKLLGTEAEIGTDYTVIPNDYR